VGRGKAPKPSSSQKSKTRVYVRCGQRDNDLTAHSVSQRECGRRWVGVNPPSGSSPPDLRTQWRIPRPTPRSAGLKVIQSYAQQNTLHPSGSPNQYASSGPRICLRPHSVLNLLRGYAGQRKLRGQSDSNLVLLRRGVGVRASRERELRLGYAIDGEEDVEGERACDQIVIEVTIPPPSLPLPPDTIFHRILRGMV